MEWQHPLRTFESFHSKFLSLWLRGEKAVFRNSLCTGHLKKVCCSSPWVSGDGCRLTLALYPHTFSFGVLLVVLPHTASLEWRIFIRKFDVFVFIAPRPTFGRPMAVVRTSGLWKYVRHQDQRKDVENGEETPEYAKNALMLEGKISNYCYNPQGVSLSVYLIAHFIQGIYSCPDNNRISEVRKQ